MIDTPPSQFQNPAHWTLRNWVDACGSPSVTDLVRYSLDYPIAEAFDGWKSKTVYSWLDRGISNRLDALRMIYALMRAGKVRGHSLFQGMMLPYHAAMFLESHACTQQFRAATEVELRALIGQDTPTDPFVHRQAIRHVHPTPPVHLAGREMDVLRLLHQINQSFVTILTGSFGIGKTAVAWHAAIEAVENDVVKQVAWLDMEQLASETNESRRIAAGHRLIALQFGWSEMLVAPDDALADLLVERLKAEPVLLVIDNLGNRDDQRRLVLAQLKVFDKDVNPHGRILVTTQEVVEPELRSFPSMSLGPIAAPAMRKVWRLAEESLLCSPSQPSQADWAKIQDIAAGNPLIMRVLLPILIKEPTALSAIHAEVVKNPETDRHEVLIGYAYRLLSAPHQWLVRAAAFKGPRCTRDELAELWLYGARRAWSELEEAVDSLVRLNFLLGIPLESETYTMASPVRRFLLNFSAPTEA